MSSFVLTTTSLNFFIKEDKLHNAFQQLKEITSWLRISHRVFVSEKEWKQLLRSNEFKTSLLCRARAISKSLKQTRLSHEIVCKNDLSNKFN